MATTVAIRNSDARRSMLSEWGRGPRCKGCCPDPHTTHAEAPGTENPELPGMSQEHEAFFVDEPAEPEWADRAAVIDYLVGAERPLPPIRAPSTKR